MPRTIAPGILFFLALLVIVAVPATAIGFFNLPSLSLPASIIVIFLAGFILGTVKRPYFEDNITTSIVALLMIGFLWFFLSLSAIQVIIIFLIGFLVGRKLEIVDVHDPFRT